jgi:hypothetical protein
MSNRIQVTRSFLMPTLVKCEWYTKMQRFSTRKVGRVRFDQESKEKDKSQGWRWLTSMKSASKQEGSKPTGGGLKNV